MDKNAVYIMNDLIDAVERLAELVRELNPGATAQLDSIDFLVERASQVSHDAFAELERS